MKKGAKQTVFVGVSGGVDSALSLAMLSKQGYDVVGVFIKTWQPEFIECTWPEERRHAIRVCARLGVPFLTLDLSKEYKKEVGDYLIKEYSRGRVPNPDVMCNKEIKFGAFLAKALEMGADFVATGHYARIGKYEIQNSKSETNSKFKIQNYKLLEGVDKNKDQSYFLWTLNQERLKHILFPVGGYKKEEVRKLAQKFNLHNFGKKDSQGVCFLGKLDMKDFLKNYIKEKKGRVILVPRSFSEVGNEVGSEVIGYHPGVLFFTLGERHGFTITKKTNNDQPYYVIGKDIKKNILYVSQNKKEVMSEIVDPRMVEIEQTNWIGEKPVRGKKYQARIHYRGELKDCEMIEFKKDTARVKFKDPQNTASSGQSLVVYNKEECLGGGIIK